DEKGHHQRDEVRERNDPHRGGFACGLRSFRFFLHGHGVLPVPYVHFFASPPPAGVTWARSPLERKLRSFDSTIRGLSPAWMERMPWMMICLLKSSSLERIVSLSYSGPQMTFA